MGLKYHNFKYLLFLFVFTGIVLLGPRLAEAAVIVEDWQHYELNESELLAGMTGRIYQTTIDNREPQNNTLYFMTTGQAVKVWLDERLIYAYGNSESEKCNDRGKRWHLVAVPAFTGTAKLSIEYIGDDYKLPDDISQVTLASAAVQTRRLFAYDAIEAVSIPVAILITLILGVYYFNQAAWKRLNIKAIALTLLLALWSFGVTYVKQLWFDAPAIWWYLVWTTFYLQPLVIALITKEVITAAKKILLQHRIRLYGKLLLAIACIQLGGAHGILYQPAVYVLLFVVILQPVLTELAREARQGNIYASYILPPAVTMILFYIVDTGAHYWHLLPKDIYLLPLSIYAFTAFAALMLREQMRREHQLEERAVSLEYEIAVAMEKAEVDPLTNCRNRRAFDRFLRQLLRQNSERKFALIMMDIDHFKRINDTCGHAVGDKVLIYCTKLIRENLVKEQRLFRWGGEEFVLYYEIKNGQDNPVHFVESLRRKIEAAVIIKGRTVTASFGIALWHGLTDTKEALFRRMDEALYLAKRRGRNQTASEQDYMQ